MKKPAVFKQLHRPTRQSEGFGCLSLLQTLISQYTHRPRSKQSLAMCFCGWFTSYMPVGAFSLLYVSTARLIQGTKQLSWTPATEGMHPFFFRRDAENFNKDAYVLSYLSTIYCKSSKVTDKLPVILLPCAKLLLHIFGDPNNSAGERTSNDA